MEQSSSAPDSGRRIPPVCRQTPPLCRWASILAEYAVVEGQKPLASTGIRQAPMPQSDWEVSGRSKGRSVVQDARFTGGIVQVPLTIDGLLSSGQYMRSIRMNLPAGAGSQLDSLSAPGES